ncbi:UVR3 AtUVR3-like 6-4 DNA photolyase protein [Obelidium mucronatum]|nr:UVR3 AtUVR3-like 6-4 DNA photolyase protein [Obelidium mucronatum]
MTGPPKTALLWLRKGLRLHDNPALNAAIRGSTHLIPVVVIDPVLVNPTACGPRPLQFFLESLHDLDASLQKRQSRLLVLSGDPVDLIPKYARLWEVSKICYEGDTGRYGSVRDAKVSASLATSGISFESFSGHTLYKSEDLKRVYGSTYPQRYEEFLKRVKNLTIDAILPDESLPAVFPPLPQPVMAWKNPIPSLKDLGFDSNDIVPPSPLVGGESHALARMDLALADERYICGFSKPETSPVAINPSSTTRLSPYLARGCLSVRVLRKKILDIYARNGKHSNPPVSLEGQILWREFFYAASYLTPNYFSMEGNPVCRQIPWSRDEDKLAAWREARTGYPWIDAAMMQLKQEGWIHHLARHAVACFLTRGDLWVDWRLGRDEFDKMLLDTDSALNNGNWMWLSASAYFHQYFRVYGPVSFAKKYAGHAAYVRYYLPVLKNMPDQYILEPWKAPRAVQVKAGCVVGTDYPARIVVHEEISKELIGRMAKAYKP